MKRFYVVSKDSVYPAQGTFCVIVDLLTGVNYLYSHYDSAGGITPLLDECGEVIVSSGFELERYREESGFNKSSGNSFNPVW